jgi:hypothetical protein
MSTRWVITTLLLPMAWRVVNYIRDVIFYAKAAVTPLSDAEIESRIKFLMNMWNLRNKNKKTV